MRSLLAPVLLSLLIASSGHAEPPDLRPEIEVMGRVEAIGLSPAGHLWLTTRAGHAYRSEVGGRSWAEVEVSARKWDPKTYSPSDVLERIDFFDQRHAIISGYISEGSDVILTQDGGATWKHVTLPVSMWVYDIRTTSDGHAWLAGSSGDVFASDDFGLTWQTLARPFGERERTMSVFFRSNVGLVGSLFSGDLAMTTDGGRTWQPFVAEGRSDVLRGCAGASDRGRR